MRAITSEVVGAFLEKRAKSSGNTTTDGQALLLHGNKIAEHRPGGIWITTAGWATNVTKERLNAIPGVSLYFRNRVLHLNGQRWSGEWVKV